MLAFAWTSNSTARWTRGKIPGGKTLYYCTPVGQVVGSSWGQSTVVENIAVHHCCLYKLKKKAFSTTSLSCVGRSSRQHAGQLCPLHSSAGCKCVQQLAWSVAQSQTDVLQQQLTWQSRQHFYPKKAQPPGLPICNSRESCHQVSCLCSTLPPNWTSTQMPTT